MELQKENWKFLNDIESLLKKNILNKLGVLCLILKALN